MLDTNRGWPESGSTRQGLLPGLRVLDLSTSVSGATATQFLADAGADVLFVEPPGGSSLRDRADWPVLGRGKRSVVLDLHDEAQLATVRSLIGEADVLVTTFRPATSRRWGFTADGLRRLNPRLVSVAVTGWGSSGPWADLPGYEGLVMAKLGYYHVKSRLASRPGPAFASVPFASWGAAQTAVHGVMAALLERETSGLGQHVEADLVRGVSTIDTWQWFTDMVSIRWPGAYEAQEAFNAKGEVQGALIYPLLIAPTSDGAWLQFAQTDQRLFLAMMEEFGLSGLWTDPKWAGLPALPTQELRTELWETMIGKVGERTLAQWQAVFDSNPNVSAETFRSGPGVFEHPQMAHDGRVVTVTDPELGPVRQPSTLVHMNEKPLIELGVAPRLNEHGPVAAAEMAGGEASAAAVDGPSGLPLAGVTVLDFGVMFAGPFGATLLTDLGARVIKIESLAGDSIRNILAFPESGGAKVMMGKESVCVDIGADEGRQIVRELVRRADVVLQAFRAGAAKRAGIDAASLREINPDLVYVNAPGYGTSGPYGSRPAYAPSMAAAAGLALTDAPDAGGAVGSMEQIKKAAVRLNAAGATVPLQADGVSALGVASTILLGLLARSRGNLSGELTATMLGTSSHAIADRLVDYDGRPASPDVDPDGYGFGPLYRIYEAAEGFVFLAAPTQQDWTRLVAALPEGDTLAGDARFATAQARAEHAEELAGALAPVFAAKAAGEWERQLAAVGVGCVQVHEGLPTTLLQTDEAASAEYAVTTRSAVFDEHLRMTPAVRFSRSRTQANGFVAAGEHTDTVLAELGYSADKIAELRERKVVR